MEQLIFLNGSIVPRSLAKISPLDQGFLYGYGLFETMRSYSGHIFLLEKHLDRLNRSARMIGLATGVLDLEKACYDTLKANQLDIARVRLTISAGEGNGTPNARVQTIPTVMIIVSRYNPPSLETYRNGYKAVISSLRQNSQSPLSRLKTANYLNNLLARREAARIGVDEAILLNDRGLICEGSTSNIFLVYQGGLFTPHEKSGCLPGITRQITIDLASELNLSVNQQEIPVDLLFKADGAFITNSLLELMPLTEVDGKLIGVGDRREKGRKLTNRLILSYKELVDKEIKSAS